MPAATKKYIISCTRGTLISKTYHSQPLTLAEAIKYYQYTLSAGASYSHERGARKVNTSPKTIKGLISALDNAAQNCGPGGTYYTFSEYAG